MRGFAVKIVVIAASFVALVPMVLGGPGARSQVDELSSGLLERALKMEARLIESEPAYVRHLRSRNTSGDVDVWAILDLLNPSKNPLIRRSCLETGERLTSTARGTPHGDCVHHPASEPFAISQYLKKMWGCHDCRSLMDGLLECYIESVVTAPAKQLVLFELDSSTVGWRERSGLRDLVQAHGSDPALKFFVVARASRTPGNWRYNMSLSKRRATSVVDILLDAGLPEDRVERLGIGWQAVQLESWLTERYGYAEVAQEAANRNWALNQSALVVVYRTSLA